MNGVIKTRHLLTHGVLIVQHFGLKVYLRCVYQVVRHPGAGCTFLGSLH